MHGRIAGAHKMEASKPASRGEFARPQQSPREVCRELVEVIKHFREKFNARDYKQIISGWEQMDCWLRIERPRPDLGGTELPFAILFSATNKLGGSFKDHSTRTGRRGGRGAYHLIGYILDLNFELAGDRRIARDLMVQLGLWQEDGRPLSPAEMKQIEARDAKERLVYATERRRQLRAIEQKREALIDLGLPEPPFESYERDATIAEIILLIEAGYWFIPCDPDTKLPAKTLQPGKHFRYLWKDNATQDIELIKRWLANGCRIGIYCGKSGVAVFDIDYKNFALSTRHDAAAREYYAGWTRAKLAHVHKWQCAIATMMITASGGNLAATPGGGFHCFYDDSARRYSNTPLTSVEGSIFECGVGFCEIKAGAGYVLYYKRYGDGNLRPLPKILAESANLST